jgi:hypothetical protein
VQERPSVRPASGEVDPSGRLCGGKALAADRLEPRMGHPLDDTMNFDILAARGEPIDPRLQRRAFLVADLGDPSK